MKTYEKPKLMALSLSGNDRLCGDCASGVQINTDPEGYYGLFGIFDSLYGDNDGLLERSDFANAFASGEGSCSNQVPIVGYCKFTSVESGNQMVAWS